MASKSMIDALNHQINNEISSGYIYLSMASYCEANSFHGFANWLKAQAKEELEHAMKFYKLINSLGGAVTLTAIPQPETQFKSLVEIFEKVLNHEKAVTKSINALYEQATKENDYATQINLQWFVTEQIEEEENASDILHLLQNIGDNYPSLMMIDSKLAKR